MTKKSALIVGLAVLILAVGLIGAGAVLAQSPTPAAPDSALPVPPMEGRGFGGQGLLGGSPEIFDATAEALNLTPQELFEQWHAGKTLDEIAETQGVDLQVVRDAVEALQTQAMKDSINQAVTDGKMTQEQADWMLQGIEKGFMTRGGMGFGPMRGGMHGMGRPDQPKDLQPDATATGTAS